MASEHAKVEGNEMRTVKINARGPAKLTTRRTIDDAECALGECICLHAERDSLRRRIDEDHNRLREDHDKELGCLREDHNRLCEYKDKELDRLREDYNRLRQELDQIKERTYWFLLVAAVIALLVFFRG
jgi:hypothetical protein